VLKFWDLCSLETGDSARESLRMASNQYTSILPTIPGLALLKAMQVTVFCLCGLYLSYDHSFTLLLGHYFYGCPVITILMCACIRLWTASGKTCIPRVVKEGRVVFFSHLINIIGYPEKSETIQYTRLYETCDIT